MVTANTPAVEKTPESSKKYPAPQIYNLNSELSAAKPLTARAKQVRGHLYLAGIAEI